MLTILELKQKTKEKGLTYEDLSQLSGVPKNSLTQIFRGRVPDPRYSTVCAIMRALDLDNDTQPPMPDYARVYEALTDNNKLLAIGYINGLLQSQGMEVAEINALSAAIVNN